MIIRAMVLVTCTMSAFTLIFPRVLRKVTKYEDTYSKEYETKMKKKWLEDKKDKTIIPNSNGENFF